MRRLVLASSAPQGAAGMHGWAPEVIGAVGGREPNPEGYLEVFYTRSPQSRSAGKASLARMFSRTDERDEPTELGHPPGAVRRGVRLGSARPFAAAACERDRGTGVRRERRQRPDDPPRYSHLLAGLIPLARVKIYPDAAHGFLFQHHEEFASDVLEFLTDGG